MRILLTGGHRNSGLTITRHLARAGHEVTIADRPLAFGLRSRYAAAYEPLPESDAPDYAQALIRLTCKLRPAVLVPHRAVGTISARRDEFERETAVLVPDAEAYAAVADKAHVYDLCGRLGIPHARVLGVDPESVAARLRSVGDDSPLAVVKPRHDLGAGRGLVFLRQQDGLAELWHTHTARHGPLIATEFVPGPTTAQLALHLLFDRDSNLIEFFVLRKLRQWPPHSGITVEATSTHDLGPIAAVLPLFRELGWRGPAEVELKEDIRDGTARLLEINPRFSGTLAFPLAAGVDMLGALLRASLGRAGAARPLEPYFAAGLRYWNPQPYLRSACRDLCRTRGFWAGLRALAMPIARRPAGNPYTLSDPAALAGKLLLPLTAPRRRKHSARVEPGTRS